MDETAHEIEAHIDRQRERLGSNLKELEDKIDAATDWREHFRERPHLFLGGAERLLDVGPGGQHGGHAAAGLEGGRVRVLPPDRNAQGPALFAASVPSAWWSPRRRRSRPGWTPST